MDELNQTLHNESMQNMYLTFLVGSETYGIQIHYITEIINVQAITVMPELPEYIKGIINLRGKIIPVLDVRVRFHKEPVPYNERTCIIVVDIGDESDSVGLIVDLVREVQTFDEDDVVPPAVTTTGEANRYISGLAKHEDGSMVLLLNVERLVSDS